MCPGNLHLYLTSAFHGILRLYRFLFLPEGPPAPGTAPSQLQVETAAHTQRSVFVFPPTEPSGLDLTIHIFSFFFFSQRPHCAE